MLVSNLSAMIFFKAKQAYGNKVNGFRFPRLRRSFDALEQLNSQDFNYESSTVVSIDNRSDGSFIPYNLPIFRRGEEDISTGVLELSPFGTG